MTKTTAVATMTTAEYRELRAMKAHDAPSEGAGADVVNAGSSAARTEEADVEDVADDEEKTLVSSKAAQVTAKRDADDKSPQAKAKAKRAASSDDDDLDSFEIDAGGAFSPLSSIAYSEESVTVDATPYDPEDADSGSSDGDAPDRDILRVTKKAHTESVASSHSPSVSSVTRARASSANTARAGATSGGAWSFPHVPRWARDSADFGERSSHHPIALFHTGKLRDDDFVVEQRFDRDTRNMFYVNLFFE